MGASFSSAAKMLAATACLLAMAACDQGQDYENIVPGEGPDRGDSSTEVINEVGGGGGPEMMPEAGAPGNGGNLTGETAP